MTLGLIECSTKLGGLRTSVRQITDCVMETLPPQKRKPVVAIDRRNCAGKQYIQGIGSFKTFDQFLYLTYGKWLWSRDLWAVMRTWLPELWTPTQNTGSNNPAYNTYQAHCRSWCAKYQQHLEHQKLYKPLLHSRWFCKTRDFKEER